jgi:cytochrome c biogenesis factor
MTVPYILPATIFGEIGFHLLGIMAACAVLTMVFFRRAYRRKLSAMVLAWLLATALSSLLVLAVAVLGAAITVTSIMVEEIEAEARPAPKPLYPPVDPNAPEGGNVEDKQ